MHFSALPGRRNRPFSHFLNRTTYSYRLIIGVVVVASLVLGPQMWSMNDGSEDSAVPMVAIVTGVNLLSSPTKGQEQLDQLNMAKTANVRIDNAIRAVQLNGMAQDSRSRLNSLCLLLC